MSGTRLRTFIAAALGALLLTGCGHAPEAVGTAAPADVAARLSGRLDTATARIGVPVVGRSFSASRCKTEAFSARPTDRFTIIATYFFAFAESADPAAHNDDVVALHQYWLTLGWDAELSYETKEFNAAYYKVARADATDVGDTFRAENSWERLSVVVASPCYLFGDLEPVWGDVTPAPSVS